jgi:Cu-processing system ATP-binding protein
MKSLEIRDVSVNFAGNHALDAVSLAMNAGEITLVAGPNGAGKSTLIRVLLGLVVPQHGSLLRDGKPAQIDSTYKEALGYLPEAVAFAETLSGRDLLRFYVRARNSTMAHAEEWLARVGLASAAKRPIRTYSRGMRQRLGLAVACLTQPDFLILDEPTGGLDQDGLRVLWEILAQFRQAGKIVLVASHDLAAFESRVDRVCLLRKGQKLADDRPDALRSGVDLPVRVRMTLHDVSKTQALVVQSLVERLGAGFSPEIIADVLSFDVRQAEINKILSLPPIVSQALAQTRFIEPGLDRVYDAWMEKNQ